MTLLQMIVVFEVAISSGVFLLGWAYQSSKTAEQHYLDWLRDTDDPQLAAYYAEHGDPTETLWDVMVDMWNARTNTY